MNSKELFLDFIYRYYLNGKIERALIELREDTIFTSAFNTSESIYSEITLKKNPLKSVGYKIGIADTNSLVRLLKAFDDPNIELHFNQNNQNDHDPYSVLITEENVKSNFLLTERGVVDAFQHNLPRELDDIIFELKFDEDLIDQFNKYKLLLKDETRDFSFFQRGGHMNILFGKSRGIASNNIAIELSVEPFFNYRKEIIFPIDTFYSIIENNKDTNIILKVVENGMLILCSSELYDNIYMLSASEHKE